MHWNWNWKRNRKLLRRYDFMRLKHYILLVGCFLTVEKRKRFIGVVTMKPRNSKRKISRQQSFSIAYWNLLFEIMLCCFKLWSKSSIVQHSLCHSKLTFQSFFHAAEKRDKVQIDLLCRSMQYSCSLFSPYKNMCLHSN